MLAGKFNRNGAATEKYLPGRVYQESFTGDYRERFTGTPEVTGKGLPGWRGLQKGSYREGGNTSGDTRSSVVRGGGVPGRAIVTARVSMGRGRYRGVNIFSASLSAALQCMSDTASIKKQPKIKISYCKNNLTISLFRWSLKNIYLGGKLGVQVGTKIYRN